MFVWVVKHTPMASIGPYHSISVYHQFITDVRPIWWFSGATPSLDNLPVTVNLQPDTADGTEVFTVQFSDVNTWDSASVSITAINPVTDKFEIDSASGKKKHMHQIHDDKLCLTGCWYCIFSSMHPLTSWWISCDMWLLVSTLIAPVVVACTIIPSILFFQVKWLQRETYLPLMATMLWLLKCQMDVYPLRILWHWMSFNLQLPQLPKSQLLQPQSQQQEVQL